MGRIIGYQYDDNVQDGDAWIGSEDGGGRTKQYTAEAVANYLNIQGKISIVGQMTYKYGITPLSGPGTFAVFGGGTDPVAFSAITKLTLSNTDVSKQRVVEFLNLLVGSDILISKQSAISTFGYYSIDNYAVNATDPAYYDLGVTFKSGNGSMEAEQIYETQNFTLAAEENISTLQTTIDAGNTYASGSSLWQWDPDQISQVDPGEGWGLVLSPEEGVIFTNGVGSSAGRSHLQATNLRIGNLTYTGSVFAANLTASRNFQLPNNSGTLALTTDITASPWDTVTGGINYANGNVGIGTTTPSAKLDVNGDALINGLTVGQGAGTSIYGNTVFGKTALNSITTGLRNVAIGNEALLDNTVGNYNIALGYQALGGNVSGNNNIAIGWQALQRAETVNKNTAVGYLALGLTSGANNTAIGYGAGYLRVGGTNGNSIDSVFIGSLTKSNGLNPENEIVIGTGAESAGSNTVVLGNDDIVSTRLKGDVIVANGNVGIGTTSPTEKLEVNGNIEINRTDSVAARLTIGTNKSFGNSFYLENNGSTQYIVAENTLAIKTLNNDTQIVLEGGSSTDNVQFITNESERMRITDTGVGIGTTTPSEKLDILNGNLNISAGYYLKSGVRTSVMLDRGSDARMVFSTLYQGATTGGYEFSTGYSGVKFLIQGDGNVGIGTTAPGAKLDVNGTTYLRSVALDTIFGYSGNNIQFTNAGNTTFNNSNVGIGTTSPGEKLEVSGYIKSSVGFKANTYTSLLESSNDTVISNSAYYNMLFKTNNAERMRITNGGNVGIGTTSPSSKLHIEDSISNGSVFKITTSASGTLQPVFDARISSNGDGFFDFNTYKSATKKIQIKSANTSYIQQVDGSGGFDIKGHLKTSLQTVNGGGVLQLHRYGALSLNNDASYAHTPASALYINTLYNTSTDYLMLLANQGSDKLVVDLNGNVGIGTTSPDSILHISDTNPQLILEDTSNPNKNKIENVDGNMRYHADYNSQMGNSRHIFFIDNSEKLRINTNGNVGIGTTSPSEKLEVSGNIKLTSSSNAIRDFNGNTLLRNTSGTLTVGNAALNIGSVYTVGAAATQSFKRSSTTDLFINSSGNVGIGTTSPGAKLDVSGAEDSVIFRRAANPSLQFINFVTDSVSNRVLSSGKNLDLGTSDAASLLLTTNNSEKMRITSAGNVGIGTTSPGQKLEVDGQVLSDGYRLAAMQTAPATRNSTGTLGEIVIDGNHIYVCYATDSWSRVALDTSW